MKLPVRFRFRCCPALCLFCGRLHLGVAATAITYNHCRTDPGPHSPLLVREPAFATAIDGWRNRSCAHVPYCVHPPQYQSEPTPVPSMGAAISKTPPPPQNQPVPAQPASVAISIAPPLSLHYSAAIPPPGVAICVAPPPPQCPPLRPRRSPPQYPRPSPITAVRFSVSTLTWIYAA